MTPEKIYINSNIENRIWLIGKGDSSFIEYTRTDAFIERAVEWIKNNYLKYPSEDCADTTKFIMDFKNYIKGE